MKIRNGFVSNSSTSSFCIYGAYLDDEVKIDVNLFRKIKKMYPKEYEIAIDKKIQYLSSFKDSKKDKDIWFYTALKNIDDPTTMEDKKIRGCEHKVDGDPKFCPECGRPTWIVVESELKKIEDYIDYDSLGDFLPIEILSGEGSYCCGRAWSSVKDDETGAQFKEGIRAALKELFGISECKTISEAWYNG